MLSSNESLVKTLEENTGYVIQALDAVSDMEDSINPMDTAIDVKPLLSIIRNQMLNFFTLFLNEEQSLRLETATGYIADSIDVINSIQSNSTCVMGDSKTLSVFTGKPITNDLVKDLICKGLSCYILFITDVFTHYPEEIKDLLQKSEVILDNMENIFNGMNDLKDVISKYTASDYFVDEKLEIEDYSPEDDVDDSIIPTDDQRQQALEASKRQQSKVVQSVAWDAFRKE